MAPPKTILITGCSAGGIGDALAREFRRRGHRVFASARSIAKMPALAALGITTLELDVTSPDSIAAAVSLVREAVGDHGLDVLVNNAGLNHVLPFADCALADLRRVLDTNVVGVLAVTQAFLPLLMDARGLVAGIGSVNQVFNPPYQVAYNASKAALAAVAHSLRVELAPLGVRVVHVVTGSVRSRLFDNAELGATGTTVPEGSLYAPLKARIEKRDFLDGIKWTATDAYAREVADDLLRPKQKPVLWRATFSTVAWLLNTLGWAGIMDSVYSKKTGLGALGQTIKKSHRD